MFNINYTATGQLKAASRASAQPPAANLMADTQLQSRDLSSELSVVRTFGTTGGLISGVSGLVLGLMLSGDLAVLQAPMFDGLRLILSRCLMMASALPK
jgi:hypothetical protein